MATAHNYSELMNYKKRPEALIQSIICQIKTDDLFSPIQNIMLGKLNKSIFLHFNPGAESQYYDYKFTFI